MRIASTGIVALWLAGPAALAAQESDSAPQAYGVYPAAPPAADTAADAAADTAAVPADTAPRVVTVPAPEAAVVRDTAGARDTANARDTAATPDTAARDTTAARVEEEPAAPEDTSLTARMDVRRGGGLTRVEFPDVRETARLAGGYTVFLELLGPESLSASGGPVTVLAPTDSAFGRLAPGVLARLRGDSALRIGWLGKVVLDGDRSAAELLRAGAVVSTGGDTLPVSRGPDGTLRIGEARVVQPDLVARNGRLHGLDRVAPPDAFPVPTSAAP